MLRELGCEEPPRSNVTEAPEEVGPLTYVFGKPGELRRDLSLVGTTPDALAFT